jgi:hypothetical protein
MAYLTPQVRVCLDLLSFYKNWFSAIAHKNWFSAIAHKKWFLKKLGGDV